MAEARIWCYGYFLPTHKYFLLLHIIPKLLTYKANLLIFTLSTFSPPWNPSGHWNFTSSPPSTYMVLTKVTSDLLARNPMSIGFFILCFNLYNHGPPSWNNFFHWFPWHHILLEVSPAFWPTFVRLFFFFLNFLLFCSSLKPQSQIGLPHVWVINVPDDCHHKYADCDHKHSGCLWP